MKRIDTDCKGLTLDLAYEQSEQLKISDVYCVNGRHGHGTNISNIKIFDTLSFFIIPGIFWRNLRKICHICINSLEVVVFLPKSNPRFQLTQVRKQLAPRQEIISQTFRTTEPPGVNDDRPNFPGKVTHFRHVLRRETTNRRTAFKITIRGDC